MQRNSRAEVQADPVRASLRLGSHLWVRLPYLALYSDGPKLKPGGRGSRIEDAKGGAAGCDFRWWKCGMSSMTVGALWGGFSGGHAPQLGTT
jgi:hypothetical protein